MDQSYLRQFEQLCTQEEAPACQTTCPVHVEARTFLNLMATGKVLEARKCLERTMPLASLTGLLCNGDCRPHCVRERVDEAVNIPLVERACVLNSSPVKPFPLPQSGKAVAVAGASLAGLSTASELSKKGHGVTVFHRGRPEDSLIEEFSGILSEQVVLKALAEVMGQLNVLRVGFVQLHEAVSVSFIEKLGEKFQAVFLGLDDGLLFDQGGIAPDFAPASEVTQQCGAGGHLFSGGGNGASPINRVASGKRAAGSIDRVLQGVDPSTARDNERVRPTLLYTSTKDVEVRVAVVPGDASCPSPAEGQAEAERCIRCSCLECVKECPYLAAYKTYPKKLAREIYNNLSVIQGLRQANQAINSCAECGLCAAVCPNNFDMGMFCATARQEMVKDNRMPPSAHEFALLDMEQSNSGDVAFVRHQPGHASSAYLFFPGCQLPASLPQETMQVYSHLCQHLQDGVGLYFHCCGAPARWSGREKLTHDTAADIKNCWQDMGKPDVVVACASCLEFFAAELPEIPYRSLWDMLDGLPLPLPAVEEATRHNTPDTLVTGSHADEGYDACCTCREGITKQREGQADQQKSPAQQQSVTAGSSEEVIPLLALHDPCAARERAGTQQAVRRILTKAGIVFEELPLHGSLTRCCGYGGLADAANPETGAQYARLRASDSPLPMVAYCAMCRERLAAEGKDTIHLLELLCGKPDMVKSLRRKPLGISERQYGRVQFREKVLTAFWKEPATPQERPDFDLRYANGIRELMEKRRILEADVITVLAHAREHGALFKDSKRQVMLTSLRPRQVTFWVEYAELAPDCYEVRNVYCHRMVVPGVPGEGRATPCILEGYAVKGGRA